MDRQPLRGAFGMKRRSPTSEALWVQLMLMTAGLGFMAVLVLLPMAAVFAVALNVAFGLAASWAIAKFHFAGKRLLITFIDLPFSVSPVISGMIYVLLFGANSVIGGWLADHDVQIIFAVPGLVIATIFVTF